MLPTLQIGPLVLPVPQLSVLLALWLGLWLAEKITNRHGFTTDALYNLTFAGLLSGLVGARLSYVLQYPTAFIQSPLSLVSFNPGLLNVFGGVVFGCLGILIYSQHAGLSIWNVLDALTPVLAVGFIGLGVSHLASGESFGSQSNLPWSIYLWGESRHPTQIYEILASTGILGLLYWRYRSFSHPGTLFLTFTALAAGAELFLEAFHGDSLTTIGGLRVTQIAAWVILATALILLEFLYKPEIKKGKNG